MCKSKKFPEVQPFGCEIAIDSIPTPVASLLQTNVYAWSFPISQKKGAFWKYVREHKCTRFFEKGSLWWTRYLKKGYIFVIHKNVKS